MGEAATPRPNWPAQLPISTAGHSTRPSFVKALFHLHFNALYVSLRSLRRRIRAILMACLLSKTPCQRALPSLPDRRRSSYAPKHASSLASLVLVHSPLTHNTLLIIALQRDGQSTPKLPERSRTAIAFRINLPAQAHLPRNLRSLQIAISKFHASQALMI